VLRPITFQGQSISYKQGNGIVKDEQITIAALGKLDPNKNRLSFALTVFNTGEFDKDIDIGNISVRDNLGKFVKVYSSSELIDEANKTARNKKIGVALGVLAGTAFSVAASTSTTNGTAYGSDGTSYMYSERITDPSIAVAGTAVSAAGGLLATRSINSTRDNTVENVQNSYVKRTTLKSKTNYTGIFTIDYPVELSAPFPVYVSVNWLNRPHKFEFLILDSKSSLLNLPEAGACIGVVGSKFEKCVMTQ